jgi:2,3-dihydroxybenzoate-AMP ligase
MKLDGFVPWPEDVAERYRQEGYWRGETLGGLLRVWAAEYADRVAVTGEGASMTYGELDAAADRLAFGLRALGIGRGRMKDLINRGGEKISAEEIENLLLGHPSVSNAAAVAMPDPVMGEKVCAYVVLRPGAEALALDGLREYLAGWGIARFKWPERIETVDALPLTKVGKVDKKALREDIAGKLERKGTGAAR